MIRFHIDKYTGWIIALSVSAVLLGTIRMLTWRSFTSTPLSPAVQTEKKPAPPVQVAVSPAEYAEEEETDKVVAAVTQLLGEFHVGPHLIRDKGTSFVASIPKNINFIEFYAELRKRLDAVDGTLEHMKDDRGKGRIEFDVLVDDKLTKHFTFLRRSGLKATSGRAAIIIDDFGYVYNDLVKEFLLYDLPLTISIIPGLKESKRVARDAAMAGKKILIHMPMEPEDEKFSDEGYTILAGQDPATIRLRVRGAFSEIPAAVGMNNHQGSKVTVDKKVMKAVLEELKRQKKFFVDSRTSSRSVAMEVARSLHLPVAANQVFIDAEDDEDFIRSQMNKLADLAINRGEVVAIAHMRKRTLRILQEVMPQLQVRGIDFVYVSDLF